MILFDADSERQRWREILWSSSPCVMHELVALEVIYTWQWRNGCIDEVYIPFYVLALGKCQTWFLGKILSMIMEIHAREDNWCWMWRTNVRELTCGILHLLFLHLILQNEIYQSNICRLNKNEYSLIILLINNIKRIFT